MQEAVVISKQKEHGAQRLTKSQCKEKQRKSNAKYTGNNRTIFQS